MALNDEELNRRREERKQEKALMDKQMRLLKIGAIITAAVMVLCGAAVLITSGMVKPQQSAPPQLQTPTTEPSVPTEPPVTEPPKPAIPDTVIHYLAGGDVNVTDKVVAAGQGVNGYDYTQLFLDLAGIMSGSQLTSVNFEGNIYSDNYGSATVSAPPQLLTALRNAGVDIVQTANSYTNHNGLRGMKSTLDGIRNAGMEPVGSFANQAEFDRTRGFIIREVEGIKIAVVAFTKGMNGMGLPEDSKNCVNLLYTDYSSTYQKVDSEGISKILRNISYEQPDVTIALVHWGSEYNDNISKTQNQIQELLLSGGVDAIIGTHPHYVQKITQDASGRVVAYSLGDLLSDGEKPGTNYSVLLDLEITKNGETGAVSITGYDYIPVFYADEREIGGTARLLRIREAMAAYENNFLDRVSEETYEAMKNALERIEARVNGK